MIKLPLEADERVLFEEGASHFHHYIAVGGTLYLTNQRLLFISHEHRVHTHRSSIALASIDRVEPFKTMLLTPNGLAVWKKDGEMEHFIVDDRKSWCYRITDVISQKA